MSTQKISKEEAEKKEIERMRQEIKDLGWSD